MRYILSLLLACSLVYVGCEKQTWQDISQRQLTKYLRKHKLPYTEAFVDDVGLIVITFNTPNLTDISALEWMPIEELELKQSNITDLSTLQYLRLLKKLNLTKSTVSDLSPLKNLNLEWLDISSTKVKTLDGLQNSPLKFLRISDTELESFKGLNLDSLEVLFMKNTKIKDLTPLINAKKLRRLYFSPEQFSTEQHQVIKGIKSITIINFYSFPEQFWEEYEQKQRKQIITIR